MNGLPQRSLQNLRQTWRLVRSRRDRQPERGRLIGRRGFFIGLIAAIMVVVATLFLDAAASEFVGQWPAWLHGPARLMTDIGLSGWYLFPAALVLLAMNLVNWHTARPRRLLRLYNWTGLAFYILLSVGLSGLIVTILKRLIGRARPYVGEGAFSFEPFSSASYASFPSGHSTTVGAMTAILFLFLPRARPLFLLLGIWLALTRIVVGAHFPSDVIAGFSFGFGMAVLTAMIFARLGYVFRQYGPHLPSPRPSFFL